MKLTGSCLCGAVRYSITAPLVNARACHCSRCRKVFSAASSAYAEVQSDSFEWSASQETLQKYTTGNGFELVFCGDCGSTVGAELHDKMHGITLGTVDGDPGIEIGMHLYVGSKAPWDHIGGDAIQFPEGPTD